MNWYKKAQIPVVDSREIPTGLGSGELYTDIGHDVTYDFLQRQFNYVDKNYNPSQPNMLWIYQNGTINTVPEQKGKNEYHSYAFSRNNKKMDMSKYYRGRYSPSRKTITILSPFENIMQFKEIPEQIISALSQTFPEAEKIIRYSNHHDNKVKISTNWFKKQTKISNQNVLPEWVEEEMLRSGKNPKRVFNDVDMQSEKVRQMIENDEVTQYLKITNNPLYERAKLGDLSKEEITDIIKKISLEKKTHELV